jgi:ATP-dependent Clp protease ATP-binding subunit ClpA
MQLEAQLAERNVTFELTDEAVEWLSKKGYDDKMGARPLARVIQDSIKKKLADEILFGKLKKGGVVRVAVDGVELKLDFIPEGAKVQPKPEVEEEVAAKAAAKVTKPKSGRSKKGAPV